MAISKKKKQKEHGGQHQHPEISVALEIGTPLAPLASAKAMATLEGHLASELRSLFTTLGLNGKPQVSVTQVVSQRTIRLRINGTIHPYEPDLMRHVWTATAPVDQRQLPYAGESERQNGFPDRWLAAYVERVATDNKALGSVVEFLTRLVVEAIAERPSSLVSEEEAEMYFEDLQRPPSSTALLIPAKDLTLILRTIFDLGIRPNKSGLLNILLLAQEHALNVDDMIESAFTQLRSGKIEIHAHPDYLKNLLNPKTLSNESDTGDSSVSAVRQLVSNLWGRLVQEHSTPEGSIYSEQTTSDVQALFREMEEQLFLESGLRLPDLVWVGSPNVPDGFVSLKINGWMSVPVLALQPGEVFVDLLPEQLAGVGEPTQVAVNPRTGKRGSVFKDNKKQPLNQSWGPFTSAPEFFLSILFRQLRKDANKLFGIEDTEYHLAQLEQYFPRLIQVTTSRFPMGEITRVIRSLLSEGLPVRNTWLILEKLLQFDTVPVDSADQLILDDRLPVKTENGNTRISGSTAHQEFVRASYKNYLSYKYRQSSGNINAMILIGADGLNAPPMSSLDLETVVTEPELERFKDELWAEIGKAESSEPPFVLLTSPLIRKKVHDLISAELGELPVIAFNEISLCRIKPVAWVSLTKHSNSGPNKTTLGGPAEAAATLPAPIVSG